MDFHDTQAPGSSGIEPYLDTIFSRYRVLDLQHERVIRGEVKPGFARLRDKLEGSLRTFAGRYSFEEVEGRTFLTISAAVGARPGRNLALHLGLFLATVFTTLLVGSLREGGDPFSAPSQLWLGLPFSASIMLILLVHEMGHYFAARRHGMDVTLPFFIPIPPPVIFGTMGALIKMRSPMFSRRTLLDVGAAGPLAGFIVSLPVVVLGLMHSGWSPTPSQYFIPGHSLLFGGLAKLILGPAPPGHYLDMSAVAFAGWIGFFVTSLNLLPLGQLDGGHIAYALLGKRHDRLAYVFFLLLVAMGFIWPGWFFWALMVLLLIRIKHPPILDGEIPLGRGRMLVGVSTMLILAVTFMPLPITV